MENIKIDFVQANFYISWFIFFNLKKNDSIKFCKNVNVVDDV